MPQKKNQPHIFDFLLIYPDMDNQGLIRKRSVFIAQTYVLVMTLLAWFFNTTGLFTFGLILIATGILTTFIYHFKNGKNADFFLFGGFATGILASFVFMTRYGGIVSSGGLVLAGPAIVLLSLIFQRKEWSAILMVLYLITLVAAALIGTRLSALSPLAPTQNIVFFTGNALLLSYLVLEVVVMLFRKSEEAQLASKALQDRSLSFSKMKSGLYKKLTGPFKSPLYDIQTMVRLILSDVDPPVRKKLEQIEADSEYLMNILRQMQDLSLLEAKTLKFNRIQSDFIPYVKNISKYYKNLASGKSVSLSFRSNIDQFNLDFDPEKVQTLFSNLISDAILRCSANGEISLAVNRERENSFKDFLEIILSDSGSPISQEKTNLILHPETHKWDNDPELVDWMNLAYSFAGHLIRSMRGNVFVRSKSGGGNRIRIHLPVNNSASFIGQEEVLQKYNITPLIQPAYTEARTGNDPRTAEERNPSAERQTASKSTVGGHY